MPTCIGFNCRKPTNTVLYLRGDGKWLADTMTRFEVPPDYAKFMIGKLIGCEPSEVSSHTKTEDLPLSCCGECARKAGFPPPVHPGAPGPIIQGSSSSRF